MKIGMEQRWKETDRENRSTWTKTCPIDTLSSTNVTWTDLESSPGLRGKRPVN